MSVPIYVPLSDRILGGVSRVAQYLLYDINLRKVKFSAVFYFINAFV
jgi:hypothetical protein